MKPSAIRLHRISTGRTLEDVSAMTKLHVSTLSRFERGLLRLRPERIRSLVEALGIPVEEQTAKRTRRGRG